MNTFWRGALVQVHVVHALILRETRTRFGAHQLGYLWALLEPVIWIATFATMYKFANRRVPTGMDTVGFLATGILTYELFAGTASRVGEAINGNRALLFYPQVQPLDLAIARAALELATLITVFMLIMALNALIFPNDVAGVDDPLQVAVGLTLACLLGAGLGLTMCTLSVLSNVVERLRGPLMRPLFWFSGLFFTVDDVPHETRNIVLGNPVFHAVELVRAGWFKSYDSPSVSAGYVCVFALGLLLFGLFCERAVRHRVELT
jgi:capsular polysaccharide transport system permease protein